MVGVNPRSPGLGREPVRRPGGANRQRGAASAVGSRSLDHNAVLDETHRKLGGDVLRG